MLVSGPDVQEVPFQVSKYLTPSGLAGAGALAPSTAIAAVDDPPPEPLSLALFKPFFSVQLAPFHSSVLSV